VTREPIPVLYLAGQGRSGSTLLERVLDGVPGVVSVGEVVHLWERGLARDERCGCGLAFRACPFWRAVGEAAYGGWGALDVARVRDLQDRVDHTRLIPALLLRRLLPAYRARWGAYGEVVEALLRAVATTTGAAVVVDSSKHVSTAFLLASLPGVDLRIVHLVRDARGVAWSWSKRVRRPEVSTAVAWMPTYPARRVAARWLADNLALHALRRSGLPSALVRYEDLVAAPEAELARVLALVADRVRAPEPGTLAGDGAVHLVPGHPVAGNPLRFRTGRVDLRLDDEWRARLPARRRRGVTALAWPLLLAYGYLRRPAPAPPAVQRPPREGPRPSVSVVVPTRDRPALLAEALAAVAGQCYDGVVETVVVFDRDAPDHGLARDDPRRPVRVLCNTRTPGLAGARNTGLLAATGDLVAFCDDDDTWLPDKLRLQVDALERSGADVAVGGIAVEYDGHRVERVPAAATLTFPDLLRSRVMEAHPSTYLARRASVVGGPVGLVDEALPGSYAEDYEWLLRAARAGDVAVVRRPLARVRWHDSSFFARDWDTIAAALGYLLERYPEFRSQRRGLARVLGQIAFARAASGQRGQALRVAGAAVRADPLQPRAPLAAAVALGLLRADRLLRLLHARGRGI
jgi:hypothetical protein